MPIFASEGKMKNLQSKIVELPEIGYDKFARE